MFEFPPSLIMAIRNARRVAALTGAGISAESGIPTFRQAQTGLWAKYDPQELATPQAFRRNPRLVWDWYSWRRDLVSQANPNPGHYALADMEEKAPHFTLITQNVDGLHKRAGSRNIIELHGNLGRVKCFEEGHIFDVWETTDDPPPHCPTCGSLLRPDVVWFGEFLPREALHLALIASREADVFLTVGTSALVEPAASLPLEASTHGATLVEINPDVTPLSDRATFRLTGPSGVLLPALVAAVWHTQSEP